MAGQDFFFIGDIKNEDEEWGWNKHWLCLTTPCLNKSLDHSPLWDLSKLSVVSELFVWLTLITSERSILMFIILRKSRTPWTLLRARLSKRQHFKRDVHQATCSAEPSEQHEVVEADMNTQPPKTPHVTYVSSSDFEDTDAIVNQLAALAATVTRSSHSSTTQSKRPSSPSVLCATSTPASSFIQEEDEGESFNYLRSLITVSQQSSEPNSTTSSQDENDTQHSRKRAGSRLRLRLGDLPGVPFPSKVPRKPCPRYTPLPPAWTPKPVATRPEVRF